MIIKAWTPPRKKKKRKSIESHFIRKVTCYLVILHQTFTNYKYSSVFSFFILVHPPLSKQNFFIGSQIHSTRLINVVASNKLGSSDRRMSIPV